MLIPSIRARKAVETGCDDVEDAIAWSGALEWPWGDLWKSAMEDENFNVCVFLVLYLLLDILVGRYLIVIFDDW